MRYFYNCYSIVTKVIIATTGLIFCNGVSEAALKGDVPSPIADKQWSVLRSPNSCVLLFFHGEDNPPDAAADSRGNPLRNLRMSFRCASDGLANGPIEISYEVEQRTGRLAGSLFRISYVGTARDGVLEGGVDQTVIRFAPSLPARGEEFDRRLVVLDRGCRANSSVREAGGCDVEDGARLRARAVGRAYAPPAPKAAPFGYAIELPKGSGYLWAIVSVGKCAVIMEHGDLGLTDRGGSFSGDTLTGMGWSGMCDAQGLATGSGVLTTSSVFYDNAAHKNDRKVVLERKVTMRNGAPDGPGSWTRTDYFGEDGFKVGHPDGKNIPEDWSRGCSRCDRTKPGEDPVAAVIALARGTNGKVRAVSWSDLPAAQR